MCYPIGHAALALFIFLHTFDQTPSKEHITVLLLLSQLPDAIDKPLFWWFGAVSSRTFGHTFVVVIPLIGVAYSLGYLELSLSGILSHVLVDILFGYVPLLWPLTPFYTSQEKGRISKLKILSIIGAEVVGLAYLSFTYYEYNKHL